MNAVVSTRGGILNRTTKVAIATIGVAVAGLFVLNYESGDPVNPEVIEEVQRKTGLRDFEVKPGENRVHAKVDGCPVVYKYWDDGPYPTIQLETINGVDAKKLNNGLLLRGTVEEIHRVLKNNGIACT